MKSTQFGNVPTPISQQLSINFVHGASKNVRKATSCKGPFGKVTKLFASHGAGRKPVSKNVLPSNTSLVQIQWWNQKYFFPSKIYSVEVIDLTITTYSI